MIAQAARTAKAGARRATAPFALAAVGGLASTRIIERTAYGLARGTFGHHSGPGSLTRAQVTARVALKAAMAVTTAGVWLTSPQPAVRGAATGALAGFSWHILNDFGINV